jgi:NAD(P)-dependent dehydrogenase (short-subunit alcohol dehydrogenase family)
MIKHTSPHLREGASIIITSSVVGLMGFPGISGYIAAKHARVGIMRAAAKEFAPRRIRVNSLHPGPTSTALQDDMEMRATGASQQEAAATFDQLIPLARHATPDEIARTVVYLASDDSAFMTGATVAIDGGLTI